MEWAEAGGRGQGAWAANVSAQAAPHRVPFGSSAVSWKATTVLSSSSLPAPR